jgi:hypothetical protein
MRQLQVRPISSEIGHPLRVMAQHVGWPRLCSMRQRTFTAAALAFGLGLTISLAWSLVGGGGF